MRKDIRVLTGHNFKIALGVLTRRVLTGPLSVLVSIVDACNYRCIMCWEHSSELDAWGADDLARSYHENKKYKDKVMDFDLYKSFVKSLKDTGCKRVTLSGIGEPFLHKRLLDIVSYSIDNGIDLRLTSNGSLLNRDILKDLIDAKLANLSISVNAGARDEYAAVHVNQENETYDRIVDNLIWLSEYKKKKGLTTPNIHLTNVISNLNSHRVIEMMKFGVATGASSVSYRPLHVYPDIEKYELGEENIEQLRESFPVAKMLAAENHIDTDIDEFEELRDYRKINDIPAPCIAGWVAPFVLANGDVTYCCVSREVLGNLHDDSFRDIWLAPSRKKLNDMALKMHRTQESLPRTRCEGCERMLLNMRAHKLLWPLWGRTRSNGARPEV